MGASSLDPTEALITAAAHANLEGVRQAIKDGANVNGNGGITPLVAAIEKISLRQDRERSEQFHGPVYANILKELIKAGADVNHANSQTRMTAMHKAAEWGEPEIIFNTLRAAGARVNIPNCRNYLPHEIAAEHGDTERFKKLKTWLEEDRKREHDQGLRNRL